MIFTFSHLAAAAISGICCAEARLTRVAASAARLRSCGRFIVVLLVDAPAAMGCLCGRGVLLVRVRLPTTITRQLLERPALRDLDGAVLDLGDLAERVQRGIREQVGRC